MLLLTIMKNIKPFPHGIGLSVPNLMQGFAVGRYGAAGSHSHLIEVKFTEDEDSRKVYSANPLCNSRLGQFGGHGVQWDAPMNEKTVTCAQCRKYKGLMDGAD